MATARHEPAAPAPVSRSDLRRLWRMLRAPSGKSQIDIELEARLPRGKQWRVENGVDELDATERDRVADVLGVDLSQLPASVLPISDNARAAS